MEFRCDTLPVVFHAYSDIGPGDFAVNENGIASMGKFGSVGEKVCYNLTQASCIHPGINFFRKTRHFECNTVFLAIAHIIFNGLLIRLKNSGLLTFIICAL